MEPRRPQRHSSFEKRHESVRIDNRFLGAHKKLKSVPPPFAGAILVLLSAGDVLGSMLGKKLRMNLPSPLAPL